MADEKIKLSDIRAAYPQFADRPDDQLLIALHQGRYSHVPAGKFFASIDYDTERDKLAKQATEGTGTLQVGPIDTGIETPQWLERGLAGAGKAYADVGRTAKRLIPGNDYGSEQAKEDQALDAPLMDTTAGKVGNVAGQVALTAFPAFRAAQGVTKGAQAIGQAVRMSGPLRQALAAQAARQVGGGAIQAAAPYLGAAAGGAAAGAATSPEDIGKGALWGGVTGPLAEGAGQAASALYGGAKRAAEPLWEAGRQRVLRRTLEKKAADAAAVRAALDNPPAPLVAGAQPTLAEITGDTGIAQYQRAAQARSPEVANAIADADQTTHAAYRSTLKNLAGDDAQRAAAQKAFSEEGQKAYDELFKIKVDMAQQPPEVLRRVDSLMKRPAIQAAQQQAQDNAANAGRAFTGSNSLQGLNDMKMALDDMIAKAGGMSERKALQASQEGLIKLMDDLSGGMYSVTRDVYKDLARPVNQQSIGQHLLDKGFPPITGMDPNQNLTRVRADAFTRALNEGQQTVRRATGQNIPLEQMMEPAQLQQVQGIGQSMARRAGVEEAGRIKGSPTAQLLPAGADVAKHMGLQAVELATGVPVARIAEMGAVVAKLPFNLTKGAQENLLAQALTNPDVARRVMSSQDPTTWLQALQPYLAQAASQAALGKAQQ